MELLWVRDMLYEFDLIDINTPTMVYEDNQSTISWCKEPQLTKRTKHIFKKFQFVKDLIDRDVITIQYISTTDQLADILTKDLGPLKFKTLLSGASPQEGC